MVTDLIDRDEQPEEMIHCEVMEEAGLILGVFWLIIQCPSSPGGTDEVVHLLIGRCSSGGVGGVHGSPEEGEGICVCTWPLEDVLQAVHDGWINNVASITALQ